MNLKENSEKINFVKWLSDIKKDSWKLAGIKAANLGEIYNNQIQTPQGFVITTKAYEYFLEKAGIKEKISELLENLDKKDINRIKETSRQIKTFIIESNIPKELEEEILEAYELLDAREENIEKGAALDILKNSSEPVFVSVRNSIVIENPKETSFAGMQNNYLNIKGEKQLIEHIKKCFASSFNSKALYYRIKKEIPLNKISAGVIIQKMIDADKAGVIFSQDSLDSKNIIIESIWGLGEGLTSGEITPDRLILSEDLEIISKKISDKKIAITRKASGEKNKILLNPEKSEHPVLKDHEIMRLAEFTQKLEKIYDSPQNIEFAIGGGEIYIIQTRELTNIKESRKKIKIQGEVLSKGISLTEGIVSGKARLIFEESDLDLIEKGDIIIINNNSLGILFGRENLKGTIFSKGGVFSNISIILNELEIPSIFNIGDFTNKIQNEQIITLNSFNGKVYRGNVSENFEKEVMAVEISTKTKTKLLLSQPSFSEKSSKTGIKKIGLFKLEEIISESGKHPFYFQENNLINEYEELIYRGLDKVSKYFQDIWLRTSDIRSDEYKELEGSPEKKEKNPLLGMNGIRFSLQNPEIFKAEIKALKKISEKHNISTGVLFPKIISLKEFQKAKKIIKEIGFENIKIGIIIETPAAIQLIKDFCEEGVDKISFNLENLTQYMLAIDKEDKETFNLYDELHPSILYQLSYVLRVCQRYNIETNLFFESEFNIDLMRYLIQKGITSFSIKPETASYFVEKVKNIEEELVRGTDNEPRLYEQKKEEYKKEDFGFA